MIQAINKYLAKHSKERFYYLLISMVAFILLPPFTLQYSFTPILIYSTVSFVVLSCVVIISDNPKKIVYGSWALIISLAFTWFTLSPALDEIMAIRIIRSILLFSLFVATILKLLSTILKLEKINAQVIAGSVGAYLLLGLSGAMLFELIDVIYPASFEHSYNYGGGYDMVYFSFVTLSTLGYGDITPHTPQGQAVAVSLAIVGQLYLAILMAMLVGKFLKDSDW